MVDGGQTFFDTMKTLFLSYAGLLLVLFGTDYFPSLSVLDLPVRIIGTSIVFYCTWVSFRRFRERRRHPRSNPTDPETGNLG